MKVAITGGSGFIGSALAAHHCARGDRVRVLSRAVAPADLGPVDWHRGDIADPGTDLSRFVADADLLYHCAAEIRDQRRMRAVNVEGTRNLIAAAGGRVGRWIQLSSVSVYGHAPGGTITENSPLQPRGAYGDSKARADELVLEAFEQGSTQGDVIRPSNVFGPGMKSRSVSGMARAVRGGYFFHIGAPGARMNYIPVTSLVEVLVHCGTRSGRGSQVFIASDGMTVEDMSAHIARILGVRTPRLRLPEPLLRAVAAGLDWIPGFPLHRERIDALTNRTRYSSDLLRTETGIDLHGTMRVGLDAFIRHPDAPVHPTGEQAP